MFHQKLLVSTIKDNTVSTKRNPKTTYELLAGTYDLN